MGNWIGKSIEEFNLVFSVLSKFFFLGIGLYIYKRKIYCSIEINVFIDYIIVIYIFCIILL